MTHNIRKVLCTQKKSCTVVTVLLKYVNMSLNQVGDVKPEELIETILFKPEHQPAIQTKETNNWNTEVFTHLIDTMNGPRYQIHFPLDSITLKAILGCGVALPRFP